MSFTRIPDVKASSVSASPALPSAGISQVDKEASLRGRTVVHLPAEAQHQATWKQIGITWLEPVDKNPFMAKALLPEGWELRDNPIPHHQSITLLDRDHIPRVDIFIKTAFHESWARINVLSVEEGKLQLQKETEKKKIEEVEAAKTLDIVGEIRSKRSMVWSEKHPFGVFFDLDMNDHGMSATIKAQRRGCHGFFQTEEIATKALQVLKKHAGLFDKVFVREIKATTQNFMKDGHYEMVDGFTNKDWWQTEGGFAFL